MKRINLFILGVFIVIIFSACNSNSTKESTASITEKSNSINEVEVTMPEPFPIIESGSYDTSLDCYLIPCNSKMNGVSTELARLVSQDDLNKWSEGFGGVHDIQTSLNDYVNLYSFMTYFNISNEEVTEFIYNQNKVSESVSDLESKFTDDEIKVICTRDEKRIMVQFASEFSVINNGTVYSPQWIYTHSIDDYKKERIPSELILEKALMYDKIPFTSDAREALDAKINAYSKMAVDFKETTVGTKNADTTVVGSNPASATTF